MACTEWSIIWKGTAASRDRRRLGVHRQGFRTQRRPEDTGPVVRDYLISEGFDTDQTYAVGNATDTTATYTKSTLPNVWPIRVNCGK